MLSSSELQIDSEVEVFLAVYAWINYDRTKREEHAKRLLSKVRYPLMSEYALKHCYEYINEECHKLINKALSDKKKFYSSLPPEHFINRHCNQENFDITLFSEMSYEKVNLVTKVKRDVIQFDYRNFKENKVITKMPREMYTKKDVPKNFKAVTLNGDIYVFSNDETGLLCATKFSPDTGRWKSLGKSNRVCKNLFSVCGMMEKIIIAGGKNEDSVVISSCFQFDTERNAFNETAPMKLQESMPAVQFLKVKSWCQVVKAVNTEKLL